MDELRQNTAAYIAGLALVAVVGVAIAFLAAPGPVSSRVAVLALAIAVGTALAWMVPVHFSQKTDAYADVAVVIAAVLLLPVWLAALTVAAGTLAAQMRRGRAADEVAFNAAQIAIVALAGGGVLAAAGWNPERPVFADPRIMLAMPVAAAVMYLVNTACVAGVVSLQNGIGFGPALADALRQDPWLDAASQAAFVAVGVLAAVLVVEAPWALPLLAVPVVATYATLQRQSLLRDLAERARAMSDAALAEAQRLARVGSWEWHAPGDHHAWSDETFRLLGADPATLRPDHRAFLAAVHPADRERVAHLLAAGADGNDRVEVEYRAAAEAERVLYLRAEPAGRRGPYRVVVGTVQDVTERVRAEAAIRRGKDAAEAADRAKSRLLQMASHDIRAPLTAIRGYADLLLDVLPDPLTDEQRDGLETIRGSSGRLAALVTDLLDLARAERGALDLHPAPVCLPTAVGEVVHLLGPLAAAKHVGLVADLPADLPPVAADPVRLFQIVQNLVGNAVKFTDRGAVTVTAVRLDGTVEVRVTDTGIGISAEALPAIFDEFVQDGTAGKERGGAGLGLAIVRRLVEAHGGRVRAESTPGQGTTIAFSLPLADVGACPDAKRRHRVQ